MKQKAFILNNRGMSRDFSISKIGESNAYENYNIRITARDHDTLLSVTNERGTKSVEITSGDMNIYGELIGWNVLNNYLILFTQEETPGGNVDRIYRILFDGDFVENDCLFEGDLNFSINNPIESVVYFESENIQKIYWVDGRNVLRFMNFVDENMSWIIDATTSPMTCDNTYFDSNRQPGYTAVGSFTKDNSGNSRPNGVIQYFLTYFNKHGQESGYAWASELIYLSPVERGGTADGTNNNKVVLSFSNLNTSFTHIRLYSVFRSSFNGVPSAYIVGESAIANGTATIVDDAANQTTIDMSSLFYLGSRNVKPSTITYKDDTLFLGNLQSIGNQYNARINEIIESCRFVDGSDWESAMISFVKSSTVPSVSNIPYVKKSGLYPYTSQLNYTSAEITTFKSREKYRFALKFRFKDGSETDAIWIGDKINDKNQRVDAENESIDRVVAKCTFPERLQDYLSDNAEIISTVQLLVAEATYSDRLVLAQGIVHPTMFNVWERYNDRLFASPSWLTRPRNSGVASRHFESVRKSTSLFGEIECNYWSFNLKTLNPYYRYFHYKNTGSDRIKYSEKFDGIPTADYWLIVYEMNYIRRAFSPNDYSLTAYVYSGQCDSGSETTMLTQQLTEKHNFDGNGFSIKYLGKITKSSEGEGTQSTLHAYIEDRAKLWYGVPPQAIAPEDTIKTWMEDADTKAGWNGGVVRHDSFRLSAGNFSSKVYNSHANALNAVKDGESAPSAERWINTSTSSAISSLGPQKPAYYKKHLMFVDENIVTLDSPEISYGAFNFDNADYKFRIVGAARFDSALADYDIDASHGKLIGENVATENFSTEVSSGDSDGIVTYPLWLEYGLTPNSGKESTPIDEMTPSDYSYSGGMVRYWLHMWNRSGHIDGFYSDEDEYSVLRKKHFANLKFSYDTFYANTPVVFDEIDSLRQYNYTSSTYVQIAANDKKRYYDGNPQLLLDVPGTHTYPILYSPNTVNDNSDNFYLKTNAPVTLEYASGSHAVISLKSRMSNRIYTQDILPRLNIGEKDVVIPERDTSEEDTGALIPWLDEKANPEILNVIVIDDTDIKNAIWTVDRGHEVFYIEWPQGSDADTYLTHLWYNFKTYLGSDIGYIRLNGDDGFSYLISMDSIAGDGDHTTTRGSIYTSEETSIDDTTVVANIYEVASGALPRDFSSYSLGIKEYSIGTGIYTNEPYDYLDYAVRQDMLYIPEVDVVNDQYLLIGELYREPDKNSDYGGISDAAIQNCRFIPASPITAVTPSLSEVYGVQGDTYFQRWDDLRTKPYSPDSVNQVTDIASFMVETHINLDGRTDIRGNNKLTSLDLSQFNSLNPVYSQSDNFMSERDLDSDFDNDVYKSSLTWTLSKSDAALIDEWTHITLGTSLNLDGDKGELRALRRFGNDLISFQDRGIAEILFNSRTQISTEGGVPIEIGNSGKVDGKRYITNKYGCLNKWSIAEGKDALYFVDNINKAICAFSGNGIVDLTSKHGFKTWIKERNDMKPWNPSDFNNFVSFYDRVHSDVYFVSGDIDKPCLVYNELLGAFTSFFDYGWTQMIANINDKLIAYYVTAGGTRLWYMNEGFYGDFFGELKPFSVQYRVAPSVDDKIWTNIDYNADFIDVLDEDGDSDTVENEFINGDERYCANVTFDKIRVWNEYQDTLSGNSTGVSDINPIKKFRTWRYTIPRAVGGMNLDRIRNPWIFIKMEKNVTSETKTQLMQLHDVIVKYFE